METSKEVKILETLMLAVAVLLCLPGSIMAVVNAIRADPPFTIMEKKIDEETMNNH